MSSTPGSNPLLEQLYDYLHGELPSGQAAALEKALLRNPGVVKDGLDLIELMVMAREACRREGEARKELFLSNEYRYRFDDVLAQLARQEAEAEAGVVDLMRREGAGARSVEGPEQVTREDVLTVVGYLGRQAARSKIAWAASAAAAVLVAVMIFWPGGGAAGRPGVDAPAGVPGGSARVPAGGSVTAVLLGTQDAVWYRATGSQGGGMRPTGPLADGAALRVGDRYQLRRGFAQLETVRGARVVLEAPCAFEVVGENRIRLTHGTLIGHCPTQASRGFTVDTPAARVVDIGTRFGVAVDRSGETGLEVFSGEVTIAPVVDGKVEAATSVVSGRAARVRDDKLALMPAPRDPGESRFARGIAFEQHRAEVEAGGPPLAGPLIAHYAFDRAGGRALKESRGQKLFDAEVIGARWVEGRAPGKQALDFSGKGWDERVVLTRAASDRLALRGSFTISMWVRIRSLPRDSWTALITKGDESWRILARRKGGGNQIGFYITKHTVNFDVLPTNEIDLDRWHHVVVTGQAEGDSVNARLYLDGVLKGEKKLASVPGSGWPVVFGANAQTPEQFSFDGQLSEIAFLDYAVPEAGVREIYNTGRIPGTQ